MLEQKRLENHKIYYIGGAELPLNYVYKRRGSVAQKGPLFVNVHKVENVNRGG